MNAYNAGDYETALARWLPKAKAGDADGENNMGVLFESGLSSQTPRDDNRAAEWYLLAAQQGHVLAMENLARVQARLGHVEAAQSWMNQALLTRQKQAIEQQQALGAMGYALGCAVGGGCRASTVPSPTAVPQYQAQRPVMSLAPPPMLPPKPAPVCRLSPIFKDVYGNPKVECQ